MQSGKDWRSRWPENKKQWAKAAGIRGVVSID